METHVTKNKEIERSWYLIDAKNQVLGRLASEVADLLRGKKKSTFAPNLDCGDYCVVINTAKVKLTGNKISAKTYYSHSGYPGALKERTVEKLIQEDPNQVIYRAVWGMLPNNKLRPVFIKKLKLFSGNDYDHQAQQPQEYQLKG